MFKSFIPVYFILGFLIFSSCEEDRTVDPFWGLNLEWQKDTMLDKLHQLSKEGKIENRIYSFRKESRLEKDSIDARITGNLNMPVFNGDGLKSLSYSLLVEPDNENPLEFNQDFYYFFKNEMISTYGREFQEINSSDKLILKWRTSNNKHVEVTILKEINHYLVNIQV